MNDTEVQQMERSFWVRARWDQQYGIFRSESNISGLHIETRTLDEFQDLVVDLVPELIRANHGNRKDVHEIERAWTYGEQLLQAGG